MKENQWKDYWAVQQDPRHASNDQQFFENLGKEILFHTGSLKNKKVLELGCGDGSLIPYLDLSLDNYTGVDFSDSLLGKFREKYPDVNLVNNDALGFLAGCSEKFDVIFSFGVVQYFKKQELRSLFELQAKCVGEGGYVCHFGVPVKEMSAVFFRGLGSTVLVRNNKRRILARFRGVQKAF